MKIAAYYHIHLTDDPLIWTTIFLEQMKCIEDSGLKEHLSVMNVTCISQDDDRIGMFAQLCGTYNIPINLQIVKNPFDNDQDMLYNRNNDKSFTESITLNRLWQDCQKEDMKVLYFHSKGSTSYSNHVNVNDIIKHQLYHYWRSFMNWAAIEKWQQCENALNTHDIAGGDYVVTPLPHFRGNFWWATSNHIRQLPDPLDKSIWYNCQEKTDNPMIRSFPVRMYDEFWICARDGYTAYDIVDLKGKNPSIDNISKIYCERALK